MTKATQAWIAQSLKEARRLAVKTQELVALDAQVSVQTVRRAEQTGRVSFENLRSICSAIGLDAQQLVGQATQGACPIADIHSAQAAQSGQDCGDPALSMAANPESMAPIDQAIRPVASPVSIEFGECPGILEARMGSCNRRHHKRLGLVFIPVGMLMVALVCASIQASLQARYGSEPGLASSMLMCAVVVVNISSILVSFGPFVGAILMETDEQSLVDPLSNHWVDLVSLNMPFAAGLLQAVVYGANTLSPLLGLAASVAAQMAVIGGMLSLSFRLQHRDQARRSQVKPYLDAVMSGLRHALGPVLDRCHAQDLANRMVVACRFCGCTREGAAMELLLRELKLGLDTPAGRLEYVDVTSRALDITYNNPQGLCSQPSFDRALLRLSARCDAFG